MANILQVSSPTLNTDNRTLTEGQRTAAYQDNQQIQNPSDPSRVVRADGQEEGKAGDTTGEKRYGVIDYESNYGAFIKRLGEGLGLPRILEQLFAGQDAAALFGGGLETGELIEQLLSAVRVNSPEELLAFLKGQQESQAKFSGPFFDSLRSILTQNGAESLKEAVLDFIKIYNDYSSGSHFLHQMRSLTEDIGSLMFKPFQDEFSQILQEMKWDAQNGDTAANTGILNGRLIPFLSNYISRSHDYGAVRDAVMLLIFHAVRYENGSLERLQQAYERMTGNYGFEKFFEGKPQPEMEGVLQQLGQRNSGFADAFAGLILKGAGGQAGLENIQQFYQILNGMLLNESVYLPLLHILVPFQYQGKDVMSEIWADPDAEREQEDEGRNIKMLFKFDIRDLGKFHMVLLFHDRKVDMQLSVPPVLAERREDIENNVAGIMKKNGLGLSSLMVKEKTGDIQVEDVFPEIRDKERSINVRI